MRFAEAANAYLQRLSQEGGKDLPATRRRVELHLIHHFGQIPLSAITVADIERYEQVRLTEVAMRGGEKSKPKDASALGRTRPGTVNRELAVLSQLLHKAVEWGCVNRLPVKVTALPDEPTKIAYLTVEECSRLLDCAQADSAPLIYAFILIGLETSMRSSEILSIRREHIDVEGRVIFVPRRV